jgi:CDP-diacylglycerol--serine O-phosphatidyltransferase
VKLKDYVTLGNLLSGFLSVIMLIRGNYDWACYLIFIAYAFDVLDGPVARLTKQFDDFGGAFDSVCDFVSYSIAPSFIIYYAFAEKLGFNWMAAAAIGAIPITFGTIRHALYATRHMSYPGYFIGLPRPALPLFVLALLNSSLFLNVFPSPLKEISWGVVIAVILALGIFHVKQFPFVSHHGRRWGGLLAFGRIEFLFGSLAMVPIVLWLDAPFLFFDKLTFDLFTYVFVSWIEIPRTDFARVRHYVATGEVIKPLIHPDSPWRARSFGAWFHPELDPPDAGA